MKVMMILSIMIYSLSYCNAESKSIRIATLEYPPFIYKDATTVSGPVVERVLKAFAVLGIQPIITIYPISRGLLMVDSGEVDAYFSLKKTTKREETLLFVETPLLRQPFVFFVRIDTPTLWDGTFESIQMSTIGIVSNTSYGSLFDQARENNILLNLDQAQSFELNFRKLVAGRIDLVINSRDVGYAIITALNAEALIREVAPPVEIVSSYFAFTRTKDFSTLAQELNDVLRTSVME